VLKYTQLANVPGALVLAFGGKQQSSMLVDLSRKEDRCRKEAGRRKAGQHESQPGSPGPTCAPLPDTQVPCAP
jgi:hypothetical protein